MRDILVTLIVLGALPLVVARPWVGILLWSWLGYMNPHRLTWGFAFDFPFAQAAAIATLLGVMTLRERPRFIWNTTTITWILFVVWMTITTLFALDSNGGWEGWNIVIKIQLFAFLTVMLIHGRERVMPLVWVIVLSLGFFGLKGGLFVFRTAGENLVWGPPGSFIEDNNALALSLIMTVPLMWFLFQEAQGRLVKAGMGILIVLTCASILGSHSRGAALAGVAMLGLLWLKSAYKVRLGLAMLVVLPFLLLSMPKSYFERIETISTYEEDQSAMGRIRAWKVATQIAIQRPIGGGFYSISPANYRRYAPEIADWIEQFGRGHYPEAHSIYFKILGDHGFLGLALYLILGVSAYRGAGRVKAAARESPGLEWAGRLAGMLQVSFIGFFVGGAFLGLCYFDLYYALIALVLGLQISLRDARQTENVAQPVAMDPAGAPTRAPS
jgi:probable O-glycosylation ligase (exosortase A-associated)